MKALFARGTLAILLTLGAISTIARASQPIDVGSRKQLFVDDKFIASSRGVQLIMNPPAKMNQPVLVGNEPWPAGGEPSGGPGWYSSVIQENGKIRMWGSGSRVLPVRMAKDGPVVDLFAYAESEDGINFVGPEPQRCAYDKSKAEIGKHGGIGGTSVWIDPKAPPPHRYKTQAKYYPPGEKYGKLYIYSSPDGFQWTFFGQAQPFDEMDTQNIMFWDEPLEKYLLYTRKNPNRHTPARYRVVRRHESTDLLNWSEEIFVMQADEIDKQLCQTPTPQPPVDYYGAAVFRYPDEKAADSPYIMLAQTYWHWQRRPEAERKGGYPDHTFSHEVLSPATLDVRLMVSRDGIHFDRTGGRKSFLGVGLAGTFSSKFAWALPNPVRMGDELWIYYYGQNRDHDGFIDPAADGYLAGIDRAILRLDGFVSADAEYTGGELVTPLITFAGKRLELNFDGGAGGDVQVELLDENNKPIEGYSGEAAIALYGNSVRLPVYWGENKNQDVSPLAGKPIKIRFQMRDCKLYAFQFCN